MPTAPTTVDAGSLASRLRLSVTRVSRTLRREGAGAEISPTLMSALATVERHGPMTVGELATHEQVQKPTVTRIVAALLERDLIARTQDPLDGRISWLEATGQGRRLLQRIRRRRDEYLAARLKRLSPEELETLERAAELLERLTEAGP
ncbi:MAG: MarR family transcriptional regulator [Actinomycetota bacterium]|nr:MarR family transcriptional regulator [Actinomycetota bacterium]